MAAVLFILCGFGYYGPHTFGTLSACLYSRPDCSLAVANWTLTAIAALTLVAAAAAYFIEVEPLLTCRQQLLGDEPNPRSVVNVYIESVNADGVVILVGRQPVDFKPARFEIATCRFANAGRSPLLTFAATLAVARTTRVMRLDPWDGSPVEVTRSRRTTRDIALDHLTASDNESQRVLYVTVFRDVALRFDTDVRWTGAATAAGRRLRFDAPPALSFEPPERPLPRVSVPGGGGF
ncbi:MAG: hypothetical protein JO036_10140 [Candidatus Eremiobacteraeota bacterium]|nr:hypothetical protein [Candidatus Eremiobacteraeota bacterium]